MSDTFVPVTKNPPAKVKDPGIIALVMAGAGVYNAKNAELLLLPEGRSLLSQLRESFFASLLSGPGFQPSDCMDSETAVYSLAERYVRECGDRALLWSQSQNRLFRMHGWFSDFKAAGGSAAESMAALKNALSAQLKDVSFVTKIVPKKERTWMIAAETEKGAERAEAGYRCTSCGEIFCADSRFESKEAPVNAGAAEEPVTDVHTPGTHTIQLLCEYLNIPIETTLKAMLYTVEPSGGGKKLLFAMIRGDRDISVPKLSAWLEANDSGATFRRAETAEIVESFGEVAGFCGPVGVPDNVQMVADVSLKDGKNFVVGGNRPDYHRTGCCWGRDFEPPLADLALFHEGLPCPSCGGKLEETWLRNLGEIGVYQAGAAGETTLSCRDRDGLREWPYRLSAAISLESVLLSIFERRMQKTAV